MTHWYVGRASFIRVTWPPYMNKSAIAFKMPHYWRESSTCVSRLIHLSDMNILTYMYMHSQVVHESCASYITAHRADDHTYLYTYVYIYTPTTLSIQCVHTYIRIDTQHANTAIVFKSFSPLVYILSDRWCTYTHTQNTAITFTSTSLLRAPTKCRYDLYNFETLTHTHM